MELVVILVVLVLFVFAATTLATRQPSRPAPRQRARQSVPRPTEEAGRAEEARQAEEARRAEEACRARREAEAVYADVVALEAAACGLPNRSPAAPVLTAGLQLLAQDEAARRAEVCLADPIPEVAPHGEAASPGDVEPVRSFVEALQRRSVAVAGIEQLAIRGFAVATGSTADDAASLAVLAALPDTLDAVQEAVLARLGDPEFAVDVAHAIDTTIEHALGNIAPGISAAGLPHLGLVGEVALSLSTTGLGGVPLTLAKWTGKAILHGLQDLAEQVGHSEQVAAALGELVEHGGAAADTVFDLPGLDGPLGPFPVLTVALAGMREVRLLNAGSTTAAAAVRNFSLDVGGVGGGGAAGAAAGAAIGSIFPGIGTVIGGAVGGVAGAMGGRKLSNAVKMKPLRQAEVALAHVQEAHPARMRDAADRLVGAVAVDAEAARGTATVDPAPRLAGHWRALDRAAADLRTATAAHVHEVDATLARAQRAVAAGLITAPSSARTAAALAATRAALARTADAPPLPVLCALAHAAPPVCPQGRLGAEYRAAAQRAAEHLDRIGAAHAAAVRGWSTQAVSRFTATSEQLASAVDRDVAAYRGEAMTALAELDAATATVRIEAAKVGRATGSV